uniref:5'-adenylylsulfate reductase-like 4 n=1 Tax=Tanacetum cinerariifolium TaxID=118510 RepID=A0A6L2JE90_TANCI|nr:5'-adenylylsulfate reductase-like 4 [Tanacetum cinerariifolium]
MLYEHEIFSTYLRGQEVPKWFTHRSNEPSFTVPSSPKNCSICGLNLCIVNPKFEYGDDVEVWLSHWMFGKNEFEEGDQVSVHISKKFNYYSSEDDFFLYYTDGGTDCANVREYGDSLMYDLQVWRHVVLVGYNVVCTAPVYMCQCKRLNSISSYTYMTNTIQILLLAAGIIMRDTKETAALKIWFSISIFQYHDPEKEARGLSSICELKSVKDLILGDGFDGFCLVSGNEYGFGVIEGDETSLQKAINGIGTNTHEYVVMLFYASWCPFSTILRPSLSTMSSLYPSIPHFAIEESVVKPSVLSKYGVNGFPTLFVLNSTMLVRYHGSRSLSSLVNFYTDVTGVQAESTDYTSKLDTFVHEKGNNVSEPETCPFTWAKSPENLLRQETYLALASLFVLASSSCIIDSMLYVH